MRGRPRPLSGTNPPPSREPTASSPIRERGSPPPGGGRARGNLRLSEFSNSRTRGTHIHGAERGEANREIRTGRPLADMRDQ